MTPREEEQINTATLVLTIGLCILALFLMSSW